MTIPVLLEPQSIIRHQFNHVWLGFCGHSIVLLLDETLTALL